MCCFSRSIAHVSDTKIFARGLNGHQALVYEMAYAALTDVAMVLPLPVRPAGAADAVRFVNFEAYPNFFEDLASGFPKVAILRSRGNRTVLQLGVNRRTLVVHDVGAFEASFVPRLADFERLDERFRIRGDIWDSLPAYSDYGFAVFKLRRTDPPMDDGRNADTPTTSIRRVHPMALVFQRRDPQLLYYPTVHIHDESLHSEADFDHALFAQSQAGWRPEIQLRNWQRSYTPARDFIDVVRTEGLVDPSGFCFYLKLDGRRQNRDTWVTDRPQYPEPLTAPA
jgi:hypothetical protein